MKRTAILFVTLAFFFAGTTAQDVEDIVDVVESFKGVAEDFSILFGKSGKVLIDDQVAKSGKLSVNTGNPSVDIRLKRCRAVGDDVEIDLIITSHQKWTVINYIPEESQCNDDRAHAYKGENFVFVIDGERQQRNPDLITEQDIPRKLKVIIKDVDEDATAFKSLKILYSGDGNKERKYTMNFKNLPIKRQ